MSDLRIQMEALANGMSSGSAHVNKQNMASKICLLTLKFNSENIDIAKSLTTEGLRLAGRISFIRQVSEAVDAEIFEFSTCNRVLYVGFDVDPGTLATGISQIVGIDDIPFLSLTGSDAWRHLVKICSGLDSFIIGELQVMSQLRSSINIHRENNLIQTYNLGFFEHVISATRVIRKELGYTSSTESMLNLATTSLEDILSEKGTAQSIVLGFGEMGEKAVETLHALNQTNVVVVSRNPQKSANRNPELTQHCSMITYDEFEANRYKADIVISTMRCSTPAYTDQNLLPVEGESIILDFSWPPSIEQSGITNQQSLLGMEHWIRTARNIDHSQYTALIQKGDDMIRDIQKRYMDALTNKNEAKFRAFIYGRMEDLSTSWESSSMAQEKEIPQLGAFAREIATWICQQNNSFYLSELVDYVNNTNREFNSHLLGEVSRDVERSIRTLTAIV
tara:strand:+ start:2426 stop:3775 length:1350 start_codon:yes stop_codon:yes gene_type:complete